MTEDYIRKHFNEITDWEEASKYSDFSYAFMREFADYLDFNTIIQYRDFKLDFLREFRDKITFDYKITQRYSRDEKFYDEFYDKIGLIGWQHNSFNNNSHTFDFMLRYQEDINWHGIRPYLERKLNQDQRETLIEMQRYYTM